MTAHTLLGSPSLEELVTVEIEPAMVDGARHFLPANRRVFEDPRSHIVVDDARSYFAIDRGRFDLILSAPSNPWVRGVASLFTVEFYELVAEQLAPAGIFGQWLQLYEIDDALLLGVLAALHRAFAEYEVFLTHRHDILIVATNDPEGLPDPDWSVFRFPTWPGSWRTCVSSRPRSWSAPAS